MALDAPGKATALGFADHIDAFTGRKDVDRDLLAHLIAHFFLDTDLAQMALGSHRAGTVSHATVDTEKSDQEPVSFTTPCAEAKGG